MNHRFIAALLCLFSILLVFLGYLMRTHGGEFTCGFGLQKICSDYDVMYEISGSLYYGLQTLPFLFFGSIFLRKDIFFHWLYLFLSLSLIIFLFFFSIWTPSSDIGPWVFPDLTQSIVRACINLLAILSVIYVGARYSYSYSKNRAKQKV